jgi:hypothetical protein
VFWNNIWSNHQYTTYMMYRPPDSGGLASTYVPLCRFTWNWHGHGGPFWWDNNNNFAGLVDDDGSTLSAVTNYPSHPQWQRVIPPSGAFMQDPNQNP